MIQFNNLLFGYGRNNIIFKGLTGTLPTNRVIGLIGPNGAGKTTFLKLLLGELTLSSGEFVHSFSSMAYVSSDISLMFRYTVTDLVSFGRFSADSWWPSLDQHDWSIIHSVIDICQLSELKHTMYHALSSGQQQRVQLARALAQQAPILLLDEPFHHLDPGQKHHFCSLFKQHASQSRDPLIPSSVVIVSHDLASLSVMADDIYLLTNQKLHGPFNPSTIGHNDSVLKAFNITDATVLGC